MKISELMTFLQGALDVMYWGKSDVILTISSGVAAIQRGGGSAPAPSGSSRLQTPSCTGSGAKPRFNQDSRFGAPSSRQICLNPVWQVGCEGEISEPSQSRFKQI